MSRNLFGGAITGDLPSHYADVSNFRQVPDHQEVFVDNETEASIIVELLEQEATLCGLPAIRYHFKELSESNEATEVTIVSEADLSGEVFAVKMENAELKMALIGKQKVGKYRDRPDMKIDEVCIVLVLIRLANVGTDVLVSLNMPNLPVDAATEEELSVTNLIAESEGCADGSVKKHVAALRNFVNTLEVKDWSLFNVK